MSSAKDFYISVIERIFSNWTALRMVVDHGEGTIQQAQAFYPYITEFLFMNKGILDSSDIAAELEEYMESEFNTILEDDSPSQVAQELLRFYQYCTSGDSVTAAAELEKLPPTQCWIKTSNYVGQHINRTEKIEEDSSSSEDEAGDSDLQMEVEDAEWTTVTPRRKK